MRTLALAVSLVMALFGPLESLDQAIQAQVQAHRTPALERPMKAASDLGRPAVMFGGLLLLAVADPAGPGAARLAIAALVPVNLVVEGLKRATDRTRPDGEHKRSNAAFPSSHAANAATLAAVLARRWRRIAIPAWLAAAIVAFSRVYLNRHWMSDVLAGVAIGVLGAWVAMRWISPWIEARFVRAAQRRATPRTGS